MGVFNNAIPKYTGNLYNEIVVSPAEPVVPVDDIFDPILNKAVKDRLRDRWGNPIAATFGGYTELINNALLGNRNQGGTMLPGLGILSSFGRSMDKAGDFIIGGVTEGVKGLTGQGIESPLYNIFVEDEDYSGQRLLAAAANSMSKMAGAEVTEDDFRGLWSVPSLGLELATDPSIFGGALTKIAKGTGAVADMGRLLQNYDDLMARAAIDVTAPGVRPLAKKVGAHASSLLSNHRAESALKDAILKIDSTAKVLKYQYDGGFIDYDTYTKSMENVSKHLTRLHEQALKDATDVNLSKIKADADTAQGVVEADDFTKLAKMIDQYNSEAKLQNNSSKVASNIQEAFDTHSSKTSEIIDILNKIVPNTPDVQFLNTYRNDPEQMFKDLGISQNPDLFPKNNFGHTDEKFNPEYYDNRLLETLPKDFVYKYGITNRKSLLDLVKSNNLTPEATDDLERVFREFNLSKKDVSDSVKVSQSMSKMPADILLYANNEQQQIISRILTKAVDLKIISPKNISESTLDDIFDKIYTYIHRYPTSDISKDFNLFSALNHYKNVQGYYKDKFTATLEPIWNAPQYLDKPVVVKGKTVNSKVPNMERVAVRGNYKSLDKKVSRMFGDVHEDLNKFLTEHKGMRYEDPAYLQEISNFLDKKVPQYNMTYREFAEEVLEDELRGKVPYTKYKPRFEHLTSRDPVQASKAIEEFGEFSKLVNAYKENGGVLEPHLPTKASNKAIMEQFYNPTQVKLLQEQSAKNLPKLSKRASQIDSLMKYIQQELDIYEKNIGSKLGSRITEDVLGKTTSETSIGISKAINDILSRMEFKSPAQVFDFMHKKFKTSSGEVSLADLGFEVTRLPKSMLSSLETHTRKAFTDTVVKIDGKPSSLFDLITTNVAKNADSMISEEDFNKFFADKVNMSYTEFTKRVKNANVERLSVNKPLTQEFYDVYNQDPENFVKNLKALGTREDVLDIIINNRKRGARHAIQEAVNYLSKEQVLNDLVKPDLYLKNWLNDYRVVKTNKSYQFLNRLRPNLGSLSEENYTKYIDDLRRGSDVLFEAPAVRLNFKDPETKDALALLKSHGIYVNYADPKSVLKALNSVTKEDEFASVKKYLGREKPSLLDNTVVEIYNPDIPFIKKVSEADTDRIALDLQDTLSNDDVVEAIEGKLKLYEEADLAERVRILNEACPDETPITMADLKAYLDSDGGKNPIVRYVEENNPRQIRLFELLSNEFRLSLKSKQDRNAIMELPHLKQLLDDAEHLEEVLAKDSTGTARVYHLLDKQRGSVVRGTDFLTDLVQADGRKIIAYHNTTDAALAKATKQAISYNAKVINNAITKAGGKPIIEVLDNLGTTRNIGYRMVGDQKSWALLKKIAPDLKLKDVVFEPPVKLIAEELNYLNTTGKPVIDILNRTQKEASVLYKKMGFDYNDPDYFKHTFKNTKGYQESVGTLFYEGLDIKTSEQLADMVRNLDYLGDMRGVYGAIPNARVFEGNISRYNGMFSTKLDTIVKGTFTKGIFANEKFQTTVSVFENNDFKLNTYCKNIDDVKNILNSEANVRNLTIASPRYTEDGVFEGFTKYDNFSDASLEKALEQGDAVFVPTNIFSTLDKACKQRAKMSNKFFAFVNRYLTAPFKIGILLNPGFLLGNMNDAYLKQASTMAKKYGTSVPEELANVASSIRSTIYLNNRFKDVYDKYIDDIENVYKLEMNPADKLYSQVAKSKPTRDGFLNYLDGTYEYEIAPGQKDFITPNLTDDEKGIAKVWIHLNAVQPTEGITKELLKDTDGVNYAKNPIDRILYGLRNYDNKSPKTWGLFNNPLSKSVFGASEVTESIARSASILNDLKHQGIELDEFAKLLGETDKTEFHVKMLDAINAMHNANFDYNATSPVLESIEGFVPFPTFWLKNVSYWFDMFMNHPQYIDHALTVNEGMWANEDVTNDEFKADAKARGAVPMSAFVDNKGEHKLSNFFKGIYKPSPLQSMFTAFNTMNNPLESTIQRSHPLIQGAGVSTERQLNHLNLTTNLFDPETVRYRPYNTDQYQPNINVDEDDFSAVKYTAHKLNPFDRALNTGLRTPGKVRRGEAQLSDFLPSVFQPDFSKK
jgi:hypothetical protein